MLMSRVLTRVNRQSFVSGKLTAQFSYNNATGSTSNFLDDEEPKKPERKLREWRKMRPMEDSNLKAFDAPVPKNRKLMMPRQVFRLPKMELKLWWRMNKKNFVKLDQRFMIPRHQTLGCDLAAAHFLVHRGGKVKFYDQTDWIVKDENGYYKLPGKYDPDWQITHLDASGIALYYEGVENFQNLYRVCWANFSKNPNLDDWCMDKISVNFRNIEYLDVSECKNVTERGLEALYRLYSLKTLIITDFHKKPSFELSCTMLEDCNPGLTIKIMNPAEISEKKVE